MQLEGFGFSISSISRSSSADERTASPFFHAYKTQRFIKRRCFRGLICRQLDLANDRITLKDRFHQSRPNAISLFFRKYQKILNKNDRNPIANNPNDSKQLFPFIRRQHQ